MTEEDRVSLDRSLAANNFAQDFLASSASGAGAEAMVDSDPEPQESPDSGSPGPREEDQAFSPVWVKPGGRKDGDSGFISPDGAGANQGTTGMAVNPFYGANFNPQQPLEISHGAEPDFKPLDSSLESENERYENGAQDGSEPEEGEGGEYKKYNDFTENTDNFGKPSFTDFSRLESKLCEFEFARKDSTDVKIENETPKCEKILTETVPGIETEQAIIEKFEENQTDVEKRELDTGNNDKWELESNNLENKSDNCSDQMDVTTPEPITAIKAELAEDYTYKPTQEDGCNVLDPKEESDSSSSDGEDLSEKMDQEKHYSSSSCEEEAQPYEKLPSYEGKDLICADSSLDDVVYELRTESPNPGQEMLNEKEFCQAPVAASTDTVEQDTAEPEIAGLIEESSADVSINPQSVVNENFLESKLGADTEIELEKPIKEEFESNVDEEDQDEEKDAVNSEAAFSEDQKQPGCFEQIETSLDSDVEEPEEKDSELTSDSKVVGLFPVPVVTMEPQDVELLVSGMGAATDNTNHEQQEIPGVSGVMLEEEEEAGRQEQGAEDLLDLAQQATKTGNDQEYHLEDQFTCKQENSVSVVDQTFDNETLDSLPAQPEEQMKSEVVKLDEMIKIEDVEEVEDNDIGLEKEQQILSDGSEDDSDEEEQAVDIVADKETTDEAKELIQSESEDILKEEKNDISFMYQTEIQPETVREDNVIQAEQEDVNQFSAVQEEMNSEQDKIETQPDTEDSELFSAVKDETLSEEEIVQFQPEKFDSEVLEEKIFTQFDSEEPESFTEERKEEVDTFVMPSNDMNDDAKINEEVIDSEEKEAIVPQETEIKLEREQENEKVESQIPSIEISQEPETVEATDEVTETATEANEEQVNEEMELMEETKVEERNIVPPTETFDSDEVKETIEKVVAIDETIDEIITTKEPAVERFEEDEISDASIERVETKEQNIENVETKIEADTEPQVAEEELIAPVEPADAAKVLADAEKSEASSGPIATNGWADDASIETTEDNDPVLSDKITNDDRMDNKHVVELPQSAPQQEIPMEDESKSVEVEVKAPVTEVTEVTEVNGVTEAAVVTAAVVGVVGAVGAVRKSPKPPSTLALTKTTTSKPAGKPKEPISTKAPAKSRLSSSKPLVGALGGSSRPGSGVASRPARPATAPQRTPRPTTSTSTTRPSSATTAARPGASATTRATRTVQPEVKPAGKTTPPARPSGTAGLRMKLTPRPTSTSRLREASAARVKAATPIASKPQPSGGARTPLSQRVTTASASSQSRTKTPTKPSSASASAKELPNTPFARARQARLAAKERQKTPMNGQQAEA